jgi:hypothetical protein
MRRPRWGHGIKPTIRPQKDAGRPVWRPSVKCEAGEPYFLPYEGFLFFL